MRKPARYMRWIYGFMRCSHALVVSVLCILIGFALYRASLYRENTLYYKVHDTPPQLTAQEAASASHLLANYLLNGDEISDTEHKLLAELLRYPLTLDVWHAGKQVLSSYTLGGEVHASLVTLNHHLDTSLERVEHDLVRHPATTVILTLMTHPERFNPDEKNLNDFLQPGKHSVLFICGQKHTTFLPASRWAEQNMGKVEDFVRFGLHKIGCNSTELSTSRAEMVRYDSSQYVTFAASQEAERWEDGDRVIHDEDVTKEALQHFLNQTIHWYRNNMSEEGKLAYMYYPRFDTESQHNQLVRQWICSRGLAELSHYYPENQDLRALMQRNIDYNIQAYNTIEDGKTFVDSGPWVYLSSTSSAAHALLSNPITVREYDLIIRQYLKTIKDQITNGQFRTIIKLPEGKSGALDRDFSSALSLLVLPQAWKKELITLDDTTIQQLFLNSFTYFRQFPNLYAAPWHAMAYASLYEVTGKEIHREAAFHVADYLVSCQDPQQTSPASKGGFNRSSCKSSSNDYIGSAVRVEGLAHAYALAKKENEQQRVATYRDAILKGLRHVLQGQIDEKNSYYMPNPSRAIGGVRRNGFNSTIRNDNTCHAVNGIYQVLRVMDW